MTASKNWVFTFFFVFCVFTCTQCGRTPDAIPLVDLDPNIINPDVSGDTPVYFPHAANWKDPVNHGALYLTLITEGQDPESTLCILCHNFRQDAPTCKSCHPLFPHTANWKDPLIHGTFVKGNGGSSQCTTACHGQDGSGGLSEISCRNNQCHPPYPHLNDWAQPAVHGSAAEGLGKNDCTVCHGNDFTGRGNDKKNCRGCHSVFPHEQNWTKPNKHGAFALGQQNGINDCATSCHGENLEGGLSQLSCQSCHEVFPHPANWVDEHGATATQLGKDVCKDCHGEDLRREIKGKNCYSCHSDYPHPEEGWIPFEGGHGSVVQQKYDGSLEACQLCHGDNLKKPKQGKNCFTCHPAYPHAFQLASSNISEVSLSEDAVRSARSVNLGNAHSSEFAIDLHQPEVSLANGQRRDPPLQRSSNLDGNFPMGPITWAQYEGHGRYTIKAEEIKDECKLCHGNDFQGGPRHNRSCFSCHEPYPHTDGWAPVPGQPGPSRHGDYVTQNSTESCATERCHGINLVPSQFPRTNGPDCRSCHNAYPHPDQAEWREEHGAAARANINSCKLCHGSRLNLAPEGSRSCQDCHASYLRHPSAKVDPENRRSKWDTYSGHGRYVMGPPTARGFNECKICHGDNFSGGASGVSCRNCHSSFPHTQNNWGAYEGHGTFALNLMTSGGETAPQTCNLCHNNPNRCALCHGDDLKGGIAGKSCFQCHSNFPHVEGIHTNQPWSSPETHGSHAFGEDKNDCDSAHCHGADFRGNRRVPGCKSEVCHSVFPHTDPNWVAPAPDTAHALTFARAVKQDPNACQGCHKNFNRTDRGRHPEMNCLRCHPDGVTHTNNWDEGTGHGQFFSRRTSSADYVDDRGDVRCWKCHGEMVAFNPEQNSPEDLALGNARDIPSCYECHQAYPHVYYDEEGQRTTSWRNMRNVEVNWGISHQDGINFGHVDYMDSSPLFTDERGNRPASGDAFYTDRHTIPAIQESCSGGTNGVCHKNAHLPDSRHNDAPCQQCHQGR